MSRRRRARDGERQRWVERARWWLAPGVATAGLLVAGAGIWRLTPLTLPAPSPAFVAGAASLSRLGPSDLHALAALGEGNTLTLATHEGLLRSSDGGRSWERVPSVSGEVLTVVTPAIGDGLSLCAGSDSFAISRDRGTSWSRPAQSPGSNVRALAASVVAPGNFSINVDPRYYAVVSEITLVSDDGGETWSEIGAAPPGVTALTVAKPGQAGDEFLFAITSAGVSRSLNTGRSWRALPELGPVRSVSALGAMIYAITADQLFFSQVGGLAFEARPFPPGNAQFVAVTSDPDTAIVVTERREIWRTSDRGRSWERRG